MDAFERLCVAVNPPVEPLAVFQEWDELERRLGMAVPSDYRQLVDTYGPGVFDDFLHLQQPRSKFSAIRLASFSQSYRKRLLAQRDSGRVLPHEPDDLLPVARTEDGDVFSWVTLPADAPAHWTLTVGNAGRSEWLDFPGGIVEFLVAVFVENFRMPFFPPDFPSPSPTFQVYPSIEELREDLRRINNDR